ncbi:MAG: hypothetical protein KJO69_06365 [Gammaproteobacteria bacterium]|nr:hypothetical protein [Gammaproteobacteria bacterium]
MPTYRVKDAETGLTLDLTGDSPPTEDELVELFAQNQPKPEQRSTGDELLRQGGLTARHAIQGVANIGTGLNDAVNLAVNEVLRRMGIDYQQGMTSQLVTEALTDIGLPEPENATERVVGTASEFVAGGGGMIKSGQLAGNAGKVIASNPLLQGVSNVSGGTAMGVAQESGATPGQQAAAGIVASALPGVAAPTSQNVVKGALRGRNTQQMQQNIDDFARSGTTPTLGQATENRTLQATESILAKTPGSAGVIAKKAQSSSDEIAEAVQKRADELVPKATAEKAGAQVSRGIAGKGGFVERFSEKASALYDDVDQHLNTSATIPMTKTRSFLGASDELTKNAPNSSKVLDSQFLRKLGVALEDDLANALDQNGLDGLPYSTVKALRSSVGRRINNMTLVEDVSKGDIKRLYGMLSEDLTAAAQAAGPDAAKAAARANSFYRAGVNRIENIERVIKKNGGPEKIYGALMSGTKEGATTLRTVMKSLKPDERKAVTAATVRRMGKATPGQQDETAEAFSINTFLTNWARLSPEARGVLFGGLGPKFNKDMESLASVAGNLRGGSSVFANPSGTQPAATANITAGTGAYALVTGNMPVLASIVGGVTLANATARAMTNPRFVRWLAVATRAPQGAAIAQANALAQIAAQEKDEDMAYIAAALEQGENNQPDN